MPFCTKCGNTLPEGSVFCAICGTAIGAHNNQPNVQTNNQPNVQTNSTQPIFQNNIYQQTFYQQPNNMNNQGQQTQAARIQGYPVKTNRSLLLYIVLTIFTCGIYGLVFIYSLAKDVNQMCKEDGENIGGLIVYIVLSFLTCGIYSYYWMYKVQNRLCHAGTRYGVMVKERGSTVVCWAILGSFIIIGPFVAMHIVINSANAIGSAYNAKLYGRV